jgi:hypothetical protein
MTQVLDPYGTPNPSQDRLNALEEINAKPKERAELEKRWGQVWDTDQITHDFQVISFLAPVVRVVRHDGVEGSLFFQHQPRYYFSFVATKDLP